MMYYPVTNSLIKLYEMMVDRRYQQFFDKTVLDANELALYGCIEVSCENYGYERDGNTYRAEWEALSKHWLHFVLHKYHRVYMAVTLKPIRFDELNTLSWSNPSNHDSCYRSAVESEVAQYYSKAYKKCWDHVPAEHRRSPAEADIEVTMYSPFSPLFEIVTVERKDLNPDDGYHDTICNIKKFGIKFTPT